MITVSTSLAAVLSLPAIEPRFFVDIETGSGTWYVSNERLTWGGNSYSARLASIPSVQTDLGPPGLVGPHDVTIDIANADGAWSQYRPEFFRGRTLTIKQGFREVDSEAVWAVKFKMTSARVVNPELFRIEAGDLLTDVRRMLVPHDDLTITRSMFSTIPEDSAGLGKPIPVSFGVALAPSYLVEEQASGIGGAGARFVARVSGVQDTEEGPRYQQFNEELIQVDNSFITVATVGAGVGVAIIAQASNPRVGGVGEIVPHFAYLGRELTKTGGHNYPNEALQTLLTHSWFGHLAASTVVDSDNWTIAGSIWRNEGHDFHGALVERRSLQDCLDDWAYAAHAHLIFRDKARIVVQSSRAAVYSFHAGNILAGTCTFRDIPLEELETTQIVRIQQVRQYTTGASAQILDPFPRTLVSFSAGSGASVERESPFIGAHYVAERVAQRWARREAAGVREYAFDSTVRAAIVEEGDLVTLQHTLYCPNVQLCEVTGMTRSDVVGFTLREANSLSFVDSLSHADTDIAPVNRAAFIRYGGGGVAINATPTTITTSHPLLNLSPGVAYPRLLPNALVTTVPSFISANNSEFSIALTSTACYNAAVNLQGFFVRV